METNPSKPTASVPDESLTDLLRRLADDSAAVLRAEVELLTHKAKELLQSMAGGVVLAMMGWMLLLTAVLSLTGAFFLWLLDYLDPLPAALVTAGLTALLGGIMVAIGYFRVKKAVRKKLS